MSSLPAFEMTDYSLLFADRFLKYPKNICVLCLRPVEKRLTCGCCAECDNFVTLLTIDDDFADGVERIVAHNQLEVAKNVSDGKEHLIINAPHTTKGKTITHALFVKDVSIFANPEKHLYYGCLIKSFFRTRSTYDNDPSKSYTLDTNFAEFLFGKIGVSDTSLFTKCWMTCLQASLQVPVCLEVIPDFWLMENRVEATLYHTCDDIANSHRKLTVECRVRGKGDEITGSFVCMDDRLVPREELENAFEHGAPIYKQSTNYDAGKGGRCEKICYKNLKDQIFIDQVWEEKFGKKIAKKEQKRKEQERKEKKEREREEQRQLAIQQKEREAALRLARASLVEATAKVDVELEQIRKLKELNREVALKNQKLADRKEAEKLAKEAEKRHAEKLKQKELERQQKFVSKKQ